MKNRAIKYCIPVIAVLLAVNIYAVKPGAGNAAGAEGPSNVQAGNNGKAADLAFDSAYELNENGDHQGALSSLNKSINKYPSSALLYCERSYTKTMLDDLEGAVADAKKTTELDKNYAPGFVRLGLALKDQKKYKESIEFLDRAIELNPNGNHIHYERADSKYCLLDYKGAIDDLNVEIKLNPGYCKAYILRGNAYDYLGENKKALSDYDMAIKIDPKDVWSYLNRGVTRSNLGDTKGALADYNKAVEIGPDDPDCYRARGSFKNQTDDYEGALKDLDKAIKLDPAMAEAYYRRGLVKSNMDDEQGAKQDFKKAYDLEPNNKIYMSHYIDIGSGMSAITDTQANKLYENTDKLKLYSDRLEKNPNDVMAYLSRAMVYMKAGNQERAGEDLKAAAGIIFGKRKQ